MNNIMCKEVKNECPYSNENSSLNQYFSRSVSIVICGTSISITVQYSAISLYSYYKIDTEIDGGN